MNKNIFVQTVVISIIFFLLLFLITFVTSKAPVEGGMKVEPIYVFIALIPFIILLIISGKLKEIKGPGGIALLMKDAAENKISMEVENNPIEIDPMIVEAKEGMNSLDRMIIESSPTALSFIVGREGYYSDFAIQEYINKLQKLPDFKHIVFITADGRFSGYMNLANFIEVMKNENIVESIETQSILNNKNTNMKSIQIDSSNKDALSLMEEENLGELAVIDQSHRFLGIINQDQIVRKVLSKIVREV